MKVSDFVKKIIFENSLLYCIAIRVKPRFKHLFMQGGVSASK